MKQFLLWTLSLLVAGLSAQVTKVAYLDANGNYSIHKAAVDYSFKRSNFSQVEGFPFTTIAHPNFKNFRNVSIADLNKDGLQEIIVCLNETLYALNADGTVHWQVQLKGTSNFPPAIADIDLDGDLEIAVQTYGVPAVGNVYVFDHEGKIMPGWPLNIENHFFLNGIALADLDGQGQLEILASERINSSQGRVHSLTLDAKPINAGWPVTIPGTPAFTPSIGDIDQDGNKELITCTTTALYVFDASGMLLDGFPLEENGSKFSYQSPILADLNSDSNLEIIGARHGDLPGTIAVTSDGGYHANWPDYDQLWTYATPAVVDIDGDGDLEVFYARPYVDETLPDDVVLGYDHNGNRLEDFQIIDLVGSEGILAIADIDNDQDWEIITASKATMNGKGLIHAYHLENGSEASNFPLLVDGFTFVNGASLSDIDNDGMMDLTALSYQLKFNSTSPDSVFINVFNLEVPYRPSSVLFNGYKGSNTHDGLFQQLFSSTSEQAIIKFAIYPNPSTNTINVDSSNIGQKFRILSQNGGLVKKGKLSQPTIDIQTLQPGIYLLKVGEQVQKFIKTN
ncbi:T9SS type A sorting domain-containing protein [Portibacter marinus]|uniref:T9SS type A sorting domain-containing protein n=1 Tax=Portibacter marinus TaxID=2898660 RepID=UPI001F47A116|nr:T9SS type A sorting domain-containing protein [Portibacter marinus]